MAKEESARLLSKVAKFVRNPLKDWSDLNAQDTDPAAQEAGYSREALKEMIERRQRNDFVRRREFDMLRKLRQREAAGERDPAATPSSFSISSNDSRSDGRALTLKKIDEIEEQMSQQWWKGRAPDRDGSAPASMASEHGRAYAPTAPDIPHDPAAPVLSQQSGEPEGLPLVYDGPLQEAAIRFAQGDDAGAEGVLLQALAPEGSLADDDGTWLGLLDLYRATGDAEKFVATNMRYAQRTKRNGPEWVSLRALARDQQALALAQGATPSANPLAAADWVAPAQLGREGLVELTRALGTAPGPFWTLDWRALATLHPDAAGPLKALFAHWAGSPVQLRFLGGARLCTVLEAATPSNERAVDAVWWQLRMQALRVMHQVDAFELVALNYCITYEVSPPPWEDPRGTYAELATGATAAAGNGMGLASDDVNDATAADSEPPVLRGELCGESSAVWRRLDAELAESELPTVSCAALLRVDLAAATSLLHWVRARDGVGHRVEFIHVHRLIVAMFSVVGIADHAVVNARIR